MTEVRAVVFDFDGVLVTHSESLKEQALAHLADRYQGLGAHYAEAYEHISFGKRGDRFDFLRRVFKNYGVAEAELETKVQAEAEIFNEYVQSGIKREGLADGAIVTLESLKEKGVPLYVNSSTATEPLKESLDELRISKYFKGIFGGPASKGENMKMIADVEEVSADQLLLIGDSVGDEIGASESGCQLVGIANDWNRWAAAAADKDFPVVNGLRQILDFV